MYRTNVNTIVKVMKYFVNSFNRVRSNESAMASAVMDFAQKRWEHRVISEEEISYLVQTLKDEERRILDIRPRLKPVDIYVSSPESYVSRRKFVDVDRVSFCLIPVKE